MAKRAAEEYITKDRGPTPNHNDSASSGTGTMSTQAQIAARKIRNPKSRLGARGNSAAGASFSSIPSPNPFGQSQQSTFTPPSSSFTFGAQQSQMSFGQDPAPASTPSIFGQNTSQSAPSSFTFGQPAQTNNTPAFGFGSNITEATQPAPSAPSTFSFTQPAQTNGSTFSFGSNNTQAAQPAPSAPSTFSFTQPSQANGSTFSFGSSSNTATTQPAPSAPTFSFGQPAQTGGSTFSFGSNANKEHPQTPSTPFAFGQPAQAKEATPSFGANSNTTTVQSAPSTFAFARPAQANGTTFSFGESKKADTTQAAPPTFAFGQSAETEDTTMFSPPRKTDMPNFFQPQSAASAKTAEAPTKLLFPQSEPRPAAPPAPVKSLFLSPAPAPASTPAKVNDSLFQRPVPEPESTPAPAQKPPIPAPGKSLFQTLPPLERQESMSNMTPAADMTPATSNSLSQPAPGEPLFQRPEPQKTFSPAPMQTPQQATAPVQFEKVKLRSNAPSEPLVTDDHTKWLEHDRKYRLRSLNKELVRRLALYDPGSQDFDNILIFYYQTRERLGLMWPPGARSTKRKADDEEAPTDRASPAKRSKPSEGFNGLNNNSVTMDSSTQLNSTNPFGTSTQTSNNTPALFTGGFSNPVKPPSNGTPAPSHSSLSKPYTGPTSNTSNLFQSILSGTSTPAPQSKPKSPFANVPTQPQSAAKALFSFSQPETPLVTSPTKPVSPPTSDEVEEENDEEEQDSEDEESSDGEGQDAEPHSGSGQDSSGNDEEDEQAPPSKPENVGKSLFDRIQPPSTTDAEPPLMTPTGLQSKTTLKQPAPNHSFKPYTPFTAGFAKSTPQAPTVSPITPFGGSVKSKPLSTFEYTPKVPVTTPTPVPGASIFAGGPFKANGPIPGDGLFGSRPSTPNHDEPAPTNIFAGLAKTPSSTVDPSKDNTWSKGTPLKFDTPQKSAAGGFTFSGPASTTTNFMSAFGKNAEEHEKADKAKRKYEDLGSDAEQDEIEEWEAEYEEKQKAKRAKTTSTSGFGQGGFKPAVAQVDGQAEKSSASAPSFSITAATPPAKDTASSDNKFSNLFGQKSEIASPAAPASNLVGFSFGPVPASLSALQPAASYLFPSANTSGLSSRASSPGVTDNESVGTDGEADTTNDPQTSLMSDRPGEENEEVLYEARTKALKFMDKAAAAEKKGSIPETYNSVGLGILRVLKSAETGKSRIVIRAEPGANVLLNTHLAPFISYTNDSRAEGSGVVRFGVPVDNGKIEQWVLKVKNAGKATELAKILTENKGST